MLDKLTSLWRLMKSGEAVADPKLWQTHQITATMIGGVLIAGVQVLHSFGVDLPIDQGVAEAIAGGVLAVYNVVLTIATSKHVGLPNEKENASQENS